MQAKKLYQYITHSIIALLSVSLISSCAYDNSYGNNYPPNGSNRNSGGSYAPLLIGAAAIGAIALAKRHNDKQRDRYHDRDRNHHNDRYHNSNRGHHSRTNYDRGRTSINHSNSRSNQNRYETNRYNDRERNRNQDRSRDENSRNSGSRRNLITM